MQKKVIVMRCVCAIVSRCVFVCVYVKCLTLSDRGGKWHMCVCACVCVCVVCVCVLVCVSVLVCGGDALGCVLVVVWWWVGCVLICALPVDARVAEAALCVCVCVCVCVC